MYTPHVPTRIEMAMLVNLTTDATWARAWDIVQVAWQDGLHLRTTNVPQDALLFDADRPGELAGIQSLISYLLPLDHPVSYHVDHGLRVDL